MPTPRRSRMRCRRSRKRLLEARRAVARSLGELEVGRAGPARRPRRAVAASRRSGSAASRAASRARPDSPRRRAIVGLVGEHVADRGSHEISYERLQRLLEDDPQPRRRAGSPERISAMFSGEGIRSACPRERNAPRPADELLIGAVQVARSASAPRRASRSQSARAPARPSSPCQLARALEQRSPPPRRRRGRPRIRRVAAARATVPGASPSSSAIARLSSTRAAAAGERRRRGSRSPTSRAAPRARSSVRSGAAASASANRPCALLEVDPRAARTAQRDAVAQRASVRCEERRARHAGSPPRASRRGLAGVSLGERQRPQRLRRERADALAGLLEPLGARTGAPSRATGSGARALRLDGDQRLLDQPREHVDDLPRLRAPSSAHTASAASSSKPPAKTASRRRSTRSSALEQVVAPVDRRPQRLLARGAVRLPRRSSRKRSSRRSRDLLAGAARRPAPPPARSPAGCRRAGRRCAPRRAAFSLVQREAGRGRRGALDEQPHRLVAPAAPPARAAGSGSRDRQRRHAPRRLAGDAQRLAARRQRPQPRAARAAARRPSAARAPSRCSQLSSTSSSARGREVVDQRLVGRAAGQRARCRAPPPRRSRPAVRRRGRQLDERRRLPGERRSERRGELDASRVLPQPPAPASVSIRVSRASSARSSRSSCSRPMKELVGSAACARAPRSAGPRSCPPARRAAAPARRGVRVSSPRSDPRGAARRRRARARRRARRACPRAGPPRRRPRSVDVDLALSMSSSSRTSIAGVPSTRRAAWTTWLRLFAAAPARAPATARPSAARGAGDARVPARAA